MMALFSVFEYVSLLLMLPCVLAQSNLYAQCGGIGWTGPTTCVRGAVCVYQNPWYSQCLSGTAPAAGPPNFWFNFGDSYSQTGFNFTGPLPDASNPIGNPQFPGYTAVDGENWVGFVSSSYNKSVLYTYNYAYGGATINSGLVVPDDPTVQSLADQVDQFLSSAASRPDETPWTSANALFSVWIGVNDIGKTYGNGGDQAAFSDTLLSSYFAQIQRLYDVGARNFLFANVPPIDRSPLMLNQSASAQTLQKSIIATFNSKLLDRVDAFQSNLSEVQTFFWDSNAQFSEILDTPYYFGFKDATSYGSDLNMFWGNNYYPGVFANRLFGQAVGLNILGSTIW